MYILQIIRNVQHERYIKQLRETKVQWTQEVSCCWSTSEKDMVGGMVLNWLTQMAAWLSGNALVLINIVALRRARLVLG